jgi:predicted helicase
MYPFTGTGTFMARLLQSGLMTPDEIEKKYAGQLHANEIVLLVYCIAAINIESTYHGIVGGDYVPFDGICLTDTFQVYEKDDLVGHLLVDSSKRRRRQSKFHIRCCSPATGTGLTLRQWKVRSAPTSTTLCFRESTARP